MTIQAFNAVHFTTSFAIKTKDCNKMILYVMICCNSHLCCKTSCYIIILHRNLRYLGTSVNPLPDDKILDWSKLKQIAEEIL